MLRALAAQKLLQQRKSLRRCAAEKPVIHVRRSENDRLKDQVADFPDIPPDYLNGSFQSRCLLHCFLFTN